MSAKKRKPERIREIRNAKAGRDYTIGDKFEAGIALCGTEVKSIRMGNAQINDAYARIERGEVWLVNAYISEYSFGNFQNHEPTRKRKLLLKHREINKMSGAIEAGGKTLVPLRLYLKNNLIKVELALCIGKKLYDKRDAMKKKVALREAERAMRAYR